MRKTLYGLMGMLAVLTACNTRQFDDCSPDRIFGEWGVVNDSHSFGIEDSLYYVVNPIRSVNDTLYYNADYTDSYFSADSTRISIQYTVTDTVRLFVDRLYAVQTNPDELYLLVKLPEDTVDSNKHRAPKDTVGTNPLIFKATKKYNSDKLYTMKGNPQFREVLFSGKPIAILATNYPKTYEENGNAQNYTFTLNTAGFEESLKMCYELNGMTYPYKTDCLGTKKGKEIEKNL